MAELLVTDIDDALWERILTFSERQGRSAEELLRQLIIDYATDCNSPSSEQTQIDQQREAKSQKMRPTW